jgi:exosortase C (VPDSG-CTERM-specific)
VPFLAGLGTVSAYWIAVRSGWKPKTEDYLACMSLAFLCFVLSASFACLGTKVMRTLAFPAAFLAFMIPFPVSLHHWIESFLQHGSAEAAYLLLKLSGMPVFRVGTQFQLPGFSMEVAPQCSGIHSSLVLFIASLLAAHLLLRRPWSRLLLVLLIIPLGMLRNGFRIFVLAQLCVRVSPDWIDSDLHHRGGPIFFLVSLVPFLLLLIYLRKREQRTPAFTQPATD